VIRRGRSDGDDGTTVLEVVVALGIFAVVAGLVGAVLVVSDRTERRVVLAADAQQNARLALERLVRELRESSPTRVRSGGRAGAMWVLFASARPAADPSIFCVHARRLSAPPEASHPDCFTFPGGDVAEPAIGTYLPVWQRYVGYFVAAAPEGPVLRRVVGALSSPEGPLDSALLAGGETVAEGVEALDIAVADRLFTVTLRLRTPAPAALAVPETRLVGAGVIRN